MVAFTTTASVTNASRTILSMGDRGPEVTDLQHLIFLNGGPITLHLNRSSFVDGDFGPKTDHLVRSFQQLKGLVADGIVGAKTWRELPFANHWPAQTPGVFLRRGGDTGVEALQNRLQSAGFYAGLIDGDFGPRTEAAVIQLQGEVRWTNVEGVAGPRTFAALSSARMFV